MQIGDARSGQGDITTYSRFLALAASKAYELNQGCAAEGSAAEEMAAGEIPIPPAANTPRLRQQPVLSEGTSARCRRRTGRGRRTAASSNVPGGADLPTTACLHCDRWIPFRGEVGWVIDGGLSIVWRAQLTGWSISTTA